MPHLFENDRAYPINHQAMAMQALVDALRQGSLAPQPTIGMIRQMPDMGRMGPMGTGIIPNTQRAIADQQHYNDRTSLNAIDQMSR